MPHRPQWVGVVAVSSPLLTTQLREGRVHFCSVSGVPVQDQGFWGRNTAEGPGGRARLASQWSGSRLIGRAERDQGQDAVLKVTFPGPSSDTKSVPRRLSGQAS